jgi:C1A family cysteine protease
MSENAVSGLWDAFKIDFNKVYTEEQEPQRLAIFKANVETIYRHNAEHAKSQGWTMGINEFSDLSGSEFSMMLGFRAEDKPQGELVVLNETGLPDSVDWTTKGAVNAVKNQGQCGSCWAFGTVASVESANFNKNKELVSLSEQQLVSCDTKGGDQGCKGGLPDNAFKYVESTGLTTESNYPYTSGGLMGSASRQLLGGGKNKCDTTKIKGDLVKVTGFKDVKGESQLAAAVAQQVVAVGIDGMSIQHYSSGIFNSSCTGQIDHAVAVVGYSKDYWKVRNSWGKTWGEEGYIRMTRGSDECHIADMGSYPTM